MVSQNVLMRRRWGLFETFVCLEVGDTTSDLWPFELVATLKVLPPHSIGHADRVTLLLAPTPTPHIDVSGQMSS